MALINPTLLDDWIKPHSLEWYNQLGKQQGTYSYTWNSIILGPYGESIFDEKVRKMILGKKVLDIGCGHGEFAIKCSSVAKKIVGFDVTNQFIDQITHKKPNNVSFVIGSTKEDLPFNEGEFDCAYIRKGPTSGYPHLKQIVKKGGRVLGLHPGDDMDQELPKLFPVLYPANQSEHSTLKLIERRLMVSNFTKWDIEVINSYEILHNPIDIIKKRCFGQRPSVMEKIIKENLTEITEIFKANEVNGLPITNSYYMVSVIV